MAANDYLRHTEPCFNQGTGVQANVPAPVQGSNRVACLSKQCRGVQYNANLPTCPTCGRSTKQNQLDALVLL